MSKYQIINKALDLRRKGYTYLEIQNELGAPIPKSTLSYWFRDVKMAESYYERLKLINKTHWIEVLAKIHRTRKEERARFLKGVENGHRHLKNLFSNKDVAKIALAILYLGEGSKWKSHHGLMLGSSDPNIIRLYIKLLKRVYNISLSSLRARISYRADQNIINLTRFWSKATGLPKNSFYKTIPDPRTVGKPTKNKDYKGVCVISCGGTKIQLELEVIARMICEI